MDKTEKRTLEELMRAREELDSELVPYLEDTPVGRCIRHPLVFSVPHLPGMEALVNAQLQHKKALVKQAEAERDWVKYLALHERPYRLEKLIHVAPNMTDDEYWEQVGWVYIDLEFHWYHREDLRHLFTCRPLNRDRLMDRDDRAMYDALPDRARVYRGCADYPDSELGLSWTLDRERAVWFSRRFGSGFVASAWVNKTDVIATFAGRNEQEVVVLPEKLIKLRRSPVIGRTQRYVDSLIKASNSRRES